MIVKMQVHVWTKTCSWLWGIHWYIGWL